ncbi:ABC transporter substrate binding protein [Planctomycetota bacterium]
MRNFSPNGSLNAKLFAKKHSLPRSHLLGICLKFLLISIYLLFPYKVAAQIAQVKKVLLLHSYHDGLIWAENLTHGVELVFNKAADIQLTIEYMDTKRINDQRHYANLLALYKHKFKDAFFDVVITADDDAFFFALKHRPELFPDIPIVFCGLSYYDEQFALDYGNLTGIVEYKDMLKTMNLALRLHPDAEKIFIINDLTSTGVQRHKQYKAASEKLTRKVPVEFLEDYSIEQLELRLRNLPEKSVVILHNFNRDNRGRLFSHRQAGKMVSTACTRPIYSTRGHNLQFGIVGGFLTDGNVHGKVAAQMAVRILKGEKPSHIPVMSQGPNPPMFDYQQLQRWQINISDLPEDSILINQPAPIVKERKRLLLALTLAIIEALIIALLIINAIRKRTGRAFFANIEYHVIALAVAFGLIIWVFDAIIDSIYFYEETSFWKLFVLDIPAHELYMRLLILISFTLFGIVVSVMFVKRKQAERTLRLRNTAIYNSPNGVIIADHVGKNDNPIVYVNPSFEKITGYSLDELKGQDCRFLQGDDRDQPDLGEVRLALREQRPCHVTVRNYRKDGSMFWNKLSIIPVRNARNKLTHYIGISSDITSQIQAQQKLKKSQEQLSMALDAANDGLWDWNIKTGEAYFSPRYYTMLGYEPNEFEPSYQALVDLLHPDDKNGTEQRIRECIERKSEIFEEEFRMRTKTGEWRWILSRGKVVQRDSDDNPVRMVGTHVDITRRKTSETLIAISEERFRTLVDNIPGIVYRCSLDEHWTMYYITEGIEKLSGFPPHEFVQNKIRSFASIIHPEDHQMIKDITFEKVNKDQLFSIEYRIVTSDGNIKWVYDRGKGVRDEVGNILFLDGVLFDITNRKKAEKALYESENRYRELFDNMSSGVAVYEPVENGRDFIFKSLNRAGERINKEKKESVIGKKVTEVFPGVREFGLFDVFRRVYKTGKPEHLPVTLYKDDRHYAWFENYVYRLPSGEIVAVHDDITERRQVEEKVINLAKFPSENPSPVLRVAKDGKLLYVNDAGKPLLKQWQCRLGDTIPEYWCRIVLEVFESEQTKKVEFGCDRQVISLVIAAVKQADYVNLYGRDVTERKQVEQEREKLLKTLAAKNEELESIVYVSSHDLRSPLINIQGYSTQLRQSCEQALEIADNTKIPKEIADELSKLMLQNIPESLDYITASTAKMDMLLTGLLKLSRLGRAALELETLEIDAMVAQVIESMQFTIKKSHAKIAVDKLPQCLGDKTQINQVFTNLLDNAVKYLDPSRKGLIHISGKVENAMSLYCVKDNGIGIAPQHRDKAFEIFHQLEPNENQPGDGLGLTIVQRIIDRHNGNVWLESEPGKGSSFYIALPHSGNSTG